jgi:hypothetical protein
MKKGAELPLCAPDAPLMDMLVELTKKGCGCLLVIDHVSIRGLKMTGRTFCAARVIICGRTQLNQVLCGRFQTRPPWRLSA